MAKPLITTPLSDKEWNDLKSHLKLAAMMTGGEEPYATIPVRTILRLASTPALPLEKLK